MCLQTNTGGIYNVTTIPCLGENTSATFTAPVVGSAVNVSINSAYTLGITQNHFPVIVSDGTTSFDGIVNSGAGSATLNITAVGYAAGAPGATVGAGAIVTPGGNGRTTVNAVTGSGNISVSAGPSPNVTITAAPTFGQVTDSGLTSGNCVQASTAGLLTTVAAACGTGTLTGLTAGSNVIIGTGPSLQFRSPMLRHSRELLQPDS
jgi:hypothetical protein